MAGIRSNSYFSSRYIAGTPFEFICKMNWAISRKPLNIVSGGVLTTQKTKLNPSGGLLNYFLNKLNYIFINLIYFKFCFFN